MTRGTDSVTPDSPGWYPDPWSATGDGERYFDGKTWGSVNRPLARHTITGEKTTPLAKLRPRSIAAAAPTRSSRAAGASSRFRRFMPLVVLLVVAGGIWGLDLVRRGLDGGGSSATTITTSAEPPAADAPVDEEESTAIGADDMPPRPENVSDTPLGRPAPVPDGPGAYEFIGFQPDDPSAPIAFDPCRPIHYVINPAGAPEDGVEMMQDAIAQVSRATGLRFIDDGTTTEVGEKNRKHYQPELYDPDNWAPVLLGWSDETLEPELAGPILGFGGPSRIETATEAVYVTGTVMLDAGDLSVENMPDRDIAFGTALHEVGHLVGLGHTSDESQLMFTTTVDGVTEFQPGDLRGLAILGTQACYPDL